MLAQYLHQISRAALDVLAQASAGEFLACDLVQIDRKEFSLQTVAAAHYPQGPLRRLILGCEERLAEHLASTLARPGDVTVTDARGGLLLLCQRLEERLGTTGLDLASRQFLLHDSDRFRVHCDGPRNFHLRVAMAEGRVDLLMELTPQHVNRAWFDDQLGDQTNAAVRGGEDVAITDRATVERIVLHLSHSGADAQVKVLRADGRFDLLPATFLGGCCDSERRLLVLTCARRPGVMDDGALPPKIALVFMLQDRLLEAVCPVIEQQSGTLDEDLALPTLVVGYPRQVTYGQRRNATRVEPARAIHGTIQRFAKATRNPAIGRRDIQITVQDISTTGVRLALSAGTILSGFKAGAPVDCRFKLPDCSDLVRVTGIVRRLSLSNEGRARGTASLSVEFDAALGGTEAGLDRIRTYLRHLEPASRTDGMVLEPLKV
jgi:c-di-GMP-binding flagellar brake protein YcgR